MAQIASAASWKFDRSSFVLLYTTAVALWFQLVGWDGALKASTAFEWTAAAAQRSRRFNPKVNGDVNETAIGVCPLDFEHLVTIDGNGSVVGGGEGVHYIQRIAAANHDPTLSLPPPIKIVRQGGSFVEFEVRDDSTIQDLAYSSTTAPGKLPHELFAVYPIDAYGSERCLNLPLSRMANAPNLATSWKSNDSNGNAVVLRARCSNMGSFALVSAFVGFEYDDKEDEPANRTSSIHPRINIPACCSASSSSSSSSKFIEFVFKLSCTPQCDESKLYVEGDFQPPEPKQRLEKTGRAGGGGMGIFKSAGVSVSSVADDLLTRNGMLNKIGDTVVDDLASKGKNGLHHYSSMPGELIDLRTATDTSYMKKRRCLSGNSGSMRNLCREFLDAAMGIPPPGGDAGGGGFDSTSVAAAVAAARFNIRASDTSTGILPRPATDGVSVGADSSSSVLDEIRSVPRDISILDKINDGTAAATAASLGAGGTGADDGGRVVRNSNDFAVAVLDELQNTITDTSVLDELRYNADTGGSATGGVSNVAASASMTWDDILNADRRADYATEIIDEMHSRPIPNSFVGTTVGTGAADIGGPEAGAGERGAPSGVRFGDTILDELRSTARDTSILDELRYGRVAQNFAASDYASYADDVSRDESIGTARRFVDYAGLADNSAILAVEDAAMADRTAREAVLAAHDATNSAATAAIRGHHSEGHRNQAFIAAFRASHAAHSTASYASLAASRADRAATYADQAAGAQKTAGERFATAYDKVTAANAIVDATAEAATSAAAADKARIAADRAVAAADRASSAADRAVHAAETADRAIRFPAALNTMNLRNLLGILRRQVSTKSAAAAERSTSAHATATASARNHIRHLQNIDEAAKSPFVTKKRVGAGVAIGMIETATSRIPRSGHPEKWTAQN